MIVAGTSIVYSQNRRETIDKLKKVVQEALEKKK